MQIESLTPNASNNENNWFGEFFFFLSKYNLILSLSLSLSQFLARIIYWKWVELQWKILVEKNKNLIVSECKEVLQARQA